MESINWELEESDLSDELKVKDRSLDGRFLRYKLKIGKGSFKTVYKGRDTKENRDVAWCKVEVTGLNGYWQEKLKDEIAIQKELDHPHILPLYDSWKCPNANVLQVILVTELITGGTLKGYSKCNIIVIRNWGRQILKGLEYLHTMTPPVIHRDLKCDNVFIDKRSGLIKIGDLGLAIFKAKSHVKSVAGTDEFMAPEMYEEHYNELVDVYAFGMCLLEMYTGEYPYGECENRAQIMNKVTKGKPPNILAEVTHSVIKSIIEQCIATKEQRCTAQVLLKNDFFAESKFTVDVISEIDIDQKMVTFELKGPAVEKRVKFFYYFNLQTPESVVKELIRLNELGNDDHEQAVRAIEEKVEVLLLLRGKNDESHDGREIETDYSTTDTIARLLTQPINLVEKKEPRKNFQVDDVATPPSTNGSSQSSVPSLSYGGKVETDYSDVVVQRPGSHSTNHKTVNSSSQSGITSVPSLAASINTQSNGAQKRVEPDYTVYSNTNSGSGASSDPRDISAIKPTDPTTNDLQSRYDKLKSTDENEQEIVLKKNKEKTNKEYNKWKENRPNFTPSVVSSHQSIATVFNSKHYIDDELYSKVVSLNEGTTDSLRTRHMFDNIKRKLKSEDQKTVKETWKGLINTLRKEGDPRLERLAKTLEKLAGEKSMFVAFHTYQGQLVYQVQSSVHLFATNAWSIGILNESEKHQVTDPHFQFHEHIVSQMLDVIGDQIKDNPAVFYEVVDIFKKIGGPLKRVTEKYLSN